LQYDKDTYDSVYYAKNCLPSRSQKVTSRRIIVHVQKASVSSPDVSVYLMYLCQWPKHTGEATVTRETAATSNHKGNAISLDHRTGLNSTPLPLVG